VPDIAMCPGERCPLKNRCYRFRAFSAGRQDWLAALPFDPFTGRCPMFWDVRPYEAAEDRVRLRAFTLWEADGRPEGRADAHWHAARAELERDVLRPAAPG
jgi:hypothetical protein